MELSLPPEVSGKQHGILRVVLSALSSPKEPVTAKNSIFCLKFWGEPQTSMGILLRPPENVRQSVANRADYKIL
jgi:hypothetical protein